MKCPHCEEMIENDALNCPHCGQDLTKDQDDREAAVSEEDEYVDEHDDITSEVLKEENVFNVITGYVVLGLDFLWRALLRPDYSMRHERIKAPVSVITVIILLGLVSLLLYLALSELGGREPFGWMYFTQLFVTFVVMVALIYGAMYIMSKTLLKLPLKISKILKDYSILLVHTIAVMLLVILCLFNGWIEAMSILSLILVGFIILHPTYLVQKYTMDYMSKIGTYASVIIIFTVTVAVLLAGFYMTLSVAFIEIITNI